MARALSTKRESHPKGPRKTAPPMFCLRTKWENILRTDKASSISERLLSTMFDQSSSYPSLIFFTLIVIN